MDGRSAARLEELRRLRRVRELTAAERLELAELARRVVLESRVPAPVTRCTAS